MVFTEKIEKLLASNQLKEVIDEFLKFLSEVPQTNKEARTDANQLRGQIIILSGRFTELIKKINTDITDSNTINHEQAGLLNSFINILNQLPSNYSELYNYMEEKNEEDEWKDSQKKNTIEAYQQYFSKYPNGKYKAATIKLITELEEVKLKQDSEIKRLASMEKERRERDKTEAESQKEETVNDDRFARKNFTVTNNEGKTATSKKGLLVGVGITAIVLIVVQGITSSSTSRYENEDHSKSYYATDSVQTNTATDSPVSLAAEPEPVNPGKEKNNDAIEHQNADAIEQENAARIKAIQAALISAIRLADGAESDACYTWNTASLYKSFTGEALKMELANIESLKSQGLITDNRLEKQEFEDFVISPDGTNAEVKLTETWTSVYYIASTQQCNGKSPAHKTPQTIYLTKYDEGWFITSIVYANVSGNELEPCN
jgi:hypothetical protein